MSAQTGVLQGLIDRLQACAALVAIIEDRICIGPNGPNDIYPRVSITAIGQWNDQHLSGAGSLAQRDIQINCWSRNSPLQADEIADAIQNNLDGLSGVTWNSIPIRTIRLQNGPVNDEVPPTSGGPAINYRARMDFKITFQKTVPTLT